MFFFKSQINSCVLVHFLDTCTIDIEQKVKVQEMGWVGKLQYAEKEGVIKGCARGGKGVLGRGRPGCEEGSKEKGLGGGEEGKKTNK